MRACQTSQFSEYELIRGSIMSIMYIKNVVLYILNYLEKTSVFL